MNHSGVLGLSSPHKVFPTHWTPVRVKIKGCESECSDHYHITPPGVVIGQMPGQTWKQVTVGISAHLMIQRLWWSDQPLKVFYNTSLHKHLSIHTHIHWHTLVAEATMQSTTCSSGGITTHKQSHSDGSTTRNNLGFSILPKSCRMQDAPPSGRWTTAQPHEPQPSMEALL